MPRPYVVPTETIRIRKKSERSLSNHPWNQIQTNGSSAGDILAPSRGDLVIYKGQEAVVFSKKWIICSFLSLIYIFTIRSSPQTSISTWSCLIAGMNLQEPFLKFPSYYYPKWVGQRNDQQQKWITKSKSLVENLKIWNQWF